MSLNLLHHLSMKLEMKTYFSSEWRGIVEWFFLSGHILVLEDCADGEENVCVAFISTNMLFNKTIIYDRLFICVCARLSVCLRILVHLQVTDCDCLYAYLCLCVYAYLCVYTCVWLHVFFVCARARAFVHLCLYISIRVYLFLCIHACLNVCMYACECM